MSTTRSNNFANFQSVDNINPTIRQQQFQYNGRIFFSPDENYPKYDLYSGSSQQQDTNVSLISNIVVPNSVSRTFFSNDNTEQLQKRIIDRVFETSNHRIGKQSYEELQIIMKSIYLQYSKNLPTNIQEQVNELNNMVVDECVNRIVPNVLQYIGYLKDISSPIPIMPRSQNVSNKGYKFGDFSSLIPPSDAPYY